MIRSEMGPVAGGIALVGVLMIMIILLAVLALVVVKALADSPWGSFTVFATIPIASDSTRWTLARVGSSFVIAAAVIQPAVPPPTMITFTFSCPANRVPTVTAGSF